MKNSMNRLLIALLIAPCLVMGIGQAQAAEHSRETTTLTLSVVESKAGSRALLAAQLVTSSGTPVADAEIAFLIDGQLDGQARTGSDGRAERRLREPLTVGEHRITATFAEISSYQGSSAQTQLTVGATTLSVTLVTPQSTGEKRPLVALRLVDSQGAPVADAPITVMVDGQRSGAVRTDSNGEAGIRLAADLPLGTHTVDAIFEGLPGYLQSRGVTSFPIMKTHIELRQMAPTSLVDPYVKFAIRLLSSDGKPVPGAVVRLLVDDTEFGTDTTDTAGVVIRRIKRELAAGNHRLVVLFDGLPTLQPARSSAPFTVASSSLNIRVASELAQSGIRAPIEVLLRGADGLPIPNARIDILVDDTRDGQVWTDPQGRAVWRIRRPLGVGTFHITAAFTGLPNRQGVTASTSLVVAASRLELTTSPEMSTLRIGEPYSVTARLTTAAGVPVANGRIRLAVNDDRHSEIRTNSDGLATWTFRGVKVAGTYTLAASFDGLPGVLISQTTNQMQVAPALITVQTVPALPGVRMALGDREFMSDAQGMARIEVSSVGVYRLKLASTKTSDPRIRLEFARWMDDAFAPERNITIPTHTPIQIGFNVSYHVDQAFVDNTGQALDPTRITAIALTSSDGKAYDFVAAGPQWLQANHILRKEQGLEEQRILYAIRSVIVDGSNIVNQGQQRLYANTADAWQVQVQIYTTRFLVRDGLLDRPMGKNLYLTYPDGKTLKYALGPDGSATIPNLARGNYSAKVTAQGIANLTPLAISRNQDVTIQVLSYVDMAIFGSVLGLIGVGLLLIGRPSLLMLARHPLVTARRVATTTAGYAAAIVAALRTLPSILSTRFAWRRARSERIVAARERPQRRWFPGMPDPMASLVLVFVCCGMIGIGIGATEAAVRGTTRRQPTYTPVTVVRPSADVRPSVAPVLQPTPGVVDSPTAQPRPLATPRPLPVPTIKAKLTFDAQITLRSKGPAVQALQQRLLDLGYYHYEVTGFFGPITQEALMAFQRGHNLPTTMLPDRATINALNRCGQECGQTPSQGQNP